MNNTEPLITAAVIVALVGALANLLRALGVPISDDLVDAINDVMVIAAPIAVAIIARKYVTPLSQPRDSDGATLSRPNDVPAIKELAALQTSAIEINEDMPVPTKASPRDTPPHVGRMGMP